MTQPNTISAPSADTLDSWRHTLGVSEMSIMTKDHRQMLADLREAGFAIAIFCPDELRNASQEDVEAALVREGNEVIDMLSPLDPESPEDDTDDEG